MDTHGLQVHSWLAHHFVVCESLMTLSFVAFGWLTRDLIRIAQANYRWLWAYGLQGASNGGSCRFWNYRSTPFAPLPAIRVLGFAEFSWRS